MANDFTLVFGAGPDPNHLESLPAPAANGGLKVSIMDIDAATTTRTASGRMVRDRIAGGINGAKRKIEVVWPPLSIQQVKKVLQLTSPTFFYLGYYDPFYGTGRTAEFYVGDRSTTLMRSFSPTGDPYGQQYMWDGLSMHFIER